MRNRILGLKLLEEALKRPSGDCLPDHPLMLLLNRQEVPHDECSAQPDSADAQPRSRSGSLRARPGK